MSAIRFGMIVPSSNTTMETEIPAMLRAREEIAEERFTFHSARMRMRQVDPEQLRAMDDQSVVCAEQLADADVDVMAYACLVAIMAHSRGYHRVSQERLSAVAGKARVLTSAGALVEGLEHLGAKKVSVITPYMKPLTQTVCEYIEAEGVEVQDAFSLEVSDNLAVGRLDPRDLHEIAAKVDTSGADALVLSACVQMPSLPVVQQIQDSFDIPVVTASVATVWRTLRELGLAPVVPDAGWLLADRS